jgi:DNA modification methylase
MNISDADNSNTIDLYHGDCLDVMKGIPDGSIDLTITSPPYDNLRSYNGNNDQWGEQVWKNVIIELYRTTAQGGVVVWVVGDATIKGSETGTSFKQALWSMDCGFNLHDTMIWEKTGSGALGSNLCYGQNFEYMLIFSKGRPKSINMIKDRENKIKSGKVSTNGSLKEGRGKNRIVDRKPLGKRTNIWTLNPQKNSTHPAPFPINLAIDHIKSWSNKGDTILDPFMGSGTTGVACKNLGRSFVGIEMDKGYYDIAKDRIEQCG